MRTSSLAHARILSALLQAHVITRTHVSHGTECVMGDFARKQLEKYGWKEGECSLD